MKKFRCSRCGKPITHVVWIDHKPYGEECARFILESSPRTLRQYNEKADKIIEYMKKDRDKYDFRIVEKEWIKKEFPSLKDGKTPAIEYKLKSRSDYDYNVIATDPLLLYLTTQKCLVDPVCCEIVGGKWDEKKNTCIIEF